jgi:hypothetical protein
VRVTGAIFPNFFHAPSYQCKHMVSM